MALSVMSGGGLRSRGGSVLLHIVHALQDELCIRLNEHTGR
jgi:hypothetical protein